ncbi:MAG: 5-formyltetrahydrofolate cyclo-ligase [Pyrinomonadaceae bacterium]
MNKSELRKIYLERRSALSGDERDRASRQIAERLFASIDLADIAVLHSFISTAKFNEVDTRPIFERVWTERPDIVTCAPRIAGETGEIVNLRLDAATRLEYNAWQIGEPPAAQDEIAPEAIDAAIVPLLCFDRAGHRVGYGKGFYDRFLSRCRPDCLKVGVSFFGPVDAIDDVHLSDVPLDRCVTADDVFEFTK